MTFKESKTVELKEKFTKTLLKTVSAFSNYNDGVIYIGANDRGEVVGIPNIKESLMLIENSMNTLIMPKPIYDLDIVTIDNTSIIKMTVYKGNSGPYFYQNTAYMRNDTSTIPVDGNNLTRLVLTSQHLTYDQMVTTRNDLTFNYLENKLHEILQIQSINKEILMTLGLFQNQAYNHAALLLSDNGMMNQSFIDLAHFKLDTQIFLDRKKFEHQSLLQLLDQVTQAFKSIYPSYEVIASSHREKKESIPFIAFREAITNAIIHRDYLMPAGIQVAMFENRIEITSPGGLPEGMDEQLYFKGLTSLSRNPILATVFYRLKLIEQFGTGVHRILDVYKPFKLKPSFEILKNHIKIILPVTNYDYSKLESKHAITSYLKAFPNSPRQSIELALGIEKSSLIRRLQELEQQGTLIKKGNGPSTVYEVH
jgi:ATP-dependent DNA helicase RecG